MGTTLYIKNMVCDRCKMVVKGILEKQGIEAMSVELGEVVVSDDDILTGREELGRALEEVGFELLDDKRIRTIEKIKKLITELVRVKNDHLEVTLSQYLQEELHQEYSALSNLFSEVEGITIEKYHILQKVERVKELLVYDEMTLSEIAYQLNYSSVAYLSNQFKKVTGLTPSHFKKFRPIKRRTLDEI